MKYLTRGVCLFLVMALILPIAAMATDNRDVVGTYSYYFTSVHTSIVRTRWTSFDVCFSVVARDTMLEVGASKIEIQISTDQENWTTVRTMLPEDYPEMLCENTVSHTDSILHTGTMGYYHRAKVTYYARNSSGFGEYVHYSNVLNI